MAKMSDNIKFHGLKKIYKRGTKENPNRKNIKITITNETYDELTSFVPFGNGLYGSAFIEVCIRVMMACFKDGENLDSIAIEELKPLVQNRLIINNLYRLAKLLEV